MKKILSSILLSTTLCVSSFLPFVGQTATFAEQKDGKESSIVRDAYDVPKISANTDAKLFEKLGYTVASDRLWQLEIIKRGAKGNLAEIFGPNYIAADKKTRLQGYSEEEYIQIYNVMKHNEQEAVKSYVDGINKRIEEWKSNPDKLPLEFKTLKIMPSNWTISDSLAAGTAMMRRFGTIGGTEMNKLDELQKLIQRYGQDEGWKIFNDRYWANDSKAPTYVNSVDEVNNKNMARTFDDKEAKKFLAKLPNVEEQVSTYKNFEQKADVEVKKLGLSATAQLASFAWVVSGEKTESGRPMLSGNPQMGFDYPSIVYEAHLSGGSGYDVEGFNVIGMPVIAIGMNDHVAWSFMVGMGDNVDIYQETLNPNNKNQYKYNGKWVDFEKRVETIPVAGVGNVQYTIYRTVHGPVITPTDFDPGTFTGDKVFTWKSAHWMKDADSVGGFLDLMHAGTVKDLIKGSKDIYTSLHMVSADDKGNIGYVQTGLVPVRPENSDFRLPLSGEGDMEWTGEYIPNPYAINPEKGFVTGWNGKSTPSFNNPDSRYFGPYNRGLWLERELKDMKNMEMADMMKVQKRIGTAFGTSSGLNEAGILITDFLPLLENSLKTVPKSDANYDRLNNALQMLAKWNGQGIDDVVTSTQLKTEQLIFDRWLAALLNNVFDDELKGLVAVSTSEDDRINMLLRLLDEKTAMSRNYFDDIKTHEIETKDQMIVQSLNSALDQLTAQFKSSDMSKWQAARPNISINHPVFGKIGEFPLQTSGTYSFMVQFTAKNLNSKGIAVPVGMSRWPYGISGEIGVNQNGKPDTTNPSLWKMLNLYRNYQYRQMNNFK